MTTTKRAQTLMQQAGLVRAQDARRMLKISPRDRHRQKVLRALRWTHGWGQTTLKLLLAACSVTKGDFLTKLKDYGYFRTEYVIGRTFWMLNKSGVDLLRSMVDEHDALARLSGTRHVNLFSFSHTMFAQAVLATKLSQGGPDCEWWCDRQIRALIEPSEAGAKSPDAAFRDATGMTYIEIEKTPKKQAALEVMLLNLGRLLERTTNARAEIYIPSAIMDRYKSTLNNWLAQGTFRAWSLSTDDELFISGIYPIPATLDAALKRIKFIPSKITA